MYEIGIVAHFEAAHRLIGDFGPATRMHGHSYRVDASVQGRQLKADGTLFDIARLQGALNAITSQLHFRDLNEVPELEKVNTTAEQVAHFIWERLAPTMRNQGLETLRVQVWENERAYAARLDTL